MSVRLGLWLFAMAVAAGLCSLPIRVDRLEAGRPVDVGDVVITLYNGSRAEAGWRLHPGPRRSG